MLNLLGPHTTLLRRCVDDGADATLSVVGTLGGILVATAEQAEQRRIDWGEGEFESFLDGDRVELFLTPDVVAFLAAIGAGFNTHIDYELMSERPNWWEHP